MEEMIHLLIINKSSSSFEAILDIFREAEMRAECRQATTAKDASKALQSREWNAVVVDSQMLNLSNLSIAAISQLCPPYCPLILTGNEISEELAVKSMKSGANHCLTTNRLRCLVPIVKRNFKLTQPQNLPEQPSELDGLISAGHNCRHEHYLIDSQSLKILYGNPQAKKNLGYPTQTLYELTLDELYPHHTTTSLQKLIRPLLNGDRPEITACMWQKRKDGTPYPVELRLQLANHEASVFSVDCLDLTARKEEVDILNQERARADRHARKSQEQNRLIANVSHDLRTCLNSIILLSKNLTAQDSGLASKQREHAKTIHQTSTDLLALVDDILDVSEVRSAKQELRSERVNLHSVCQKMGKIFSPVARENNVSFSYAIRDDKIKTIQTNQLCVERILKNLLSNAFKFTEKGSVTFEVYSPADTERNQHRITGRSIAFQVTDTGIGISEEKQRLIFQPFRQAEVTTRETYGGSGLGLAICQDLAQQLGGTLQLQSVPGQGSTFTLYLPEGGPDRVRSNENDFRPKKHTEHKTEAYLSKGTVLLVDDCEMHNMALQEFLSYNIPNCISVSTAEETYQAVERNVIDCIVLDMSLHGTDGYKIMTSLKSQQEFKSIPIIIYTGKNLSSAEEKKLHQYAHAIINKSVGSYKVLQDEVLAVLSKKPQ